MNVFFATSLSSSCITKQLSPTTLQYCTNMSNVDIFLLFMSGDITQDVSRECRHQLHIGTVVLCGMEERSDVGKTSLLLSP